MQHSFRKPVETPPGRQRKLPRVLQGGKGEQECEKTRNHGPGARGRVTLVGAGPGDADLLTLKAIKALQGADVILFDDLVSDDVLEFARSEARRMLVGKRGGRDSCRQEDINELMVSLAKQGKHVVRLKSGDPSIFGRAGEEIERLERERISVTLVPGISSAVAMAADLGISLTHRDYAHSVRFVTGHSRAGCLPDKLDWKGLADPQSTLVVYMGGRTAPLFAARLLQEGLPGETPVVVAMGVSRRDSARYSTSLSELSRKDAIISDKPVLIGIGLAFRLRSTQHAGISPDCADAVAADI